MECCIDKCVKRHSPLIHFLLSEAGRVSVNEAV